MPRVTTRPNESVFEVASRARNNLSLLIRLAMAEQSADNMGTNPELEGESWWAIEELARSVRLDVIWLDEELTLERAARREAQ